MSFAVRPASFIALSAASAWRPICDSSGMRPNSVVSAAPTMAIDFGFMRMVLHRSVGRVERSATRRVRRFRRVTPGSRRDSPALRLRRAEEGEGDLVVDLFEGDLDRHVEDERL